MKTTKSYTVKIGGNKGKSLYLDHQFCVIQKLSEYAFSLGENCWKQLTPLYNACREKFPDLNSKLIQNFLRFHFTTPNWKRKPKQPPKASLIIDYQSFGLNINDNTKLTNFWLRFHKRNFPLFGKILFDKIRDPKELKLIQIFKRKEKFYCKLTLTKSSIDLASPNKYSVSVGLDVNSRRLVLSNNDFYHLKDHSHRKIEYYKNNQKSRNINNYTKDYIHKLTTRIANDLRNEEVEVLLLEDLRHLRRSSSKKLGTSKGKKLNYIINTLPYRIVQNLLEYKCLDRGIQVHYVNPAYTSRTCSRCGSQLTSRYGSHMTTFSCQMCNLKLDADLNGSRNIQKVHYTTEWTASESSPLSDL